MVCLRRRSAAGQDGHYFIFTTPRILPISLLAQGKEHFTEIRVANLKGKAVTHDAVFARSCKPSSGSGRKDDLVFLYWDDGGTSRQGWCQRCRRVRHSGARLRRCWQRFAAPPSL